MRGVFSNESQVKLCCRFFRGQPKKTTSKVRLCLTPSFCFPALVNGCHSSVFDTTLLHWILGLCFIPNCDWLVYSLVI